MGNIVLLDELTINQIAAGEVIERPSSVVKELVENSIDAGANNITVEIKNGGISYIRISDNGKGIMPDDMEIAFERHATSKIRSADDLDFVKSMGFRGEALASIASIANVELVSRTKDSETGYKIVVRAGEILLKEEVGCPCGTSITVTDLFFNTPVRYKFLKKDFTEAGYIEDAITRIALVNTNIAIKLISTGKTVINTNGNGDMKSCIYNIYGKDVAENIMDVNYSYEDINITGVVGKPAIARSNRSSQQFFVNKRFIKDKVLTSGAEKAFKGMLTIGKYGFLILNLDMSPQKVDVNVHPAKLEVRFQEESKVFKAVYHAIKDTLLKNDLISDGETKHENKAFRIINEKIENTNFSKPYNYSELSKNNSTNNNGIFNKVFQKDVDMPKEVAGTIEQIYKLREEMKNSLKEENTVYEQIQPNIDKTEIFSEENVQNNILGIKEEMQGINIEGNEILENKIQDYSSRDLIQNENNILNESGNSIIDETGSIATIEKTIVLDENIEDENEDNINENKYVGDNEETTPNIIEQVFEDSLQNKTISSNEVQSIGNKVQPFDEMYMKIFGKPIGKEETKIEPKEETVLDNVNTTTGENLSVFEKSKFGSQNYRFIGIAFKTYIILEMNGELYIIDQHAAHERIMYEKIKKNYYSEEIKDSQLMLLPDIITLTHKEMAIAKDNIKMFERAGFVLEEFGENTIKLTGVPNVCINLDTKELFLETLDEINTVARTAKQEIEDKFIATVACKAAVKANMALTKEEVDSLMSDILKLPNPFTCPHGRPTAIRMAKNEIEKKFSRR